jgi:probable phosphoglycerate mutase
MASELWLIRHGETEWSRTGQHTGRSDIPLTEAGRAQAAAIGRHLAGRRFALVITSPLVRARDTCRLAGFSDAAQIAPDLHEWDYGDYEGRSTPDIQKDRPGWNLWRDGVPNGETIEQVAGRARRVIERVASTAGDVAMFAHGHVLRILAACWTGLPPNAGRVLVLSTATISTLGFERETRAITRWNLSVSA